MYGPRNVRDKPLNDSAFNLLSLLNSLRPRRLRGE